MGSPAKPAAKDITKAREGAGRRRATPGERRAVAPRPRGVPTKKRPAGETSVTANVELEKPRRTPPPPPRATKPVSLRAGKRKPKHARKLRQARSAKKD